MRRDGGMEPRLEMGGRVEASTTGMKPSVEPTAAEIHPRRAPAETTAGLGDLWRDERRGEQGVEEQAGDFHFFSSSPRNLIFCAPSPGL